MPRHYHSSSNASSSASSEGSTSQSLSTSSSASSGLSSGAPQASNGPTPHAPGGTCYKQSRGHHDRPETVPPKHAGELDHHTEKCAQAAGKGERGGAAAALEGYEEEEGGGMMDKLKRVVKK